MTTVDRRTTREMVARTIVSYTQDITQGISAKKIISIDCERKNGDASDRTDSCTKCIKIRKMIQESEGDIDLAAITSACAFACTCTIADVNQSSNITCNFKVFTGIVSKKDAQARLRSTLESVWRIMAVEKKVPLLDFSKESNVSMLSDSATSILEECASDKFQKTVQSLGTSQIVQLNSPGLIRGINLTQVVDMVDTILIGTESFQTVIDNIHARVLLTVSSLVRSATTKIIEWVIRIVLYVIIAIALVILVKNSIKLVVYSTIVNV